MSANIRVDGAVELLRFWAFDLGLRWPVSVATVLNEQTRQARGRRVKWGVMPFRRDKNGKRYFLVGELHEWFDNCAKSWLLPLSTSKAA